MEWNTGLIESFRDDIQSQREYYLSNLLDEDSIYPNTNPFFKGDKYLRNKGILFDLSPVELENIIHSQKYPDYIFRYLGISPYVFQKNLLKSLLTNRINLIVKGRQVGSSRVLEAYILYKCYFSTNNIIICSPKPRDFFLKILNTLKTIPHYFQVGIIDISDTKITFENGSSILFTDPDYIYSHGDILILTDAFYLSKDMVNDILPIFYSRKSNLIIEGCVTTNISYFNDFYQSNECKKYFNTHVINSISIPHRDDYWSKTMIDIYSLDSFLSEFLCLVPGTPEWNREKNLYQLLG